jgi:hypothetical protein
MEMHNINGKHQGKNPLDTTVGAGKDNIKIGLKEINFFLI